MSKRDIDSLLGGYEAFNKGGVDVIVDRLSSKISVHERDSVPDRATYHGQDEIRRLIESNLEVFEDLQFEPEEAIDVGDRILIVVRQRARGRGSGAVVEACIAHVWTMRHGTPVDLRIYGSKEKALTALAADSGQSSRGSEEEG